MRAYNVATFFCGSGLKTVGLLRSRSALGSYFISCGAFDLDPEACADFEILTGAKAQVVDLGIIQPHELAARCERSPDVVVMSPPCTGYSGCLGESLSKTEKYQALNELALRAVNLALESFERKPSIILLENVPRMRTRGKEILEQIIALLRHAGYEVDLRPHDCGEWGGLAQSRERLLLVARLRSEVPSHMMMPPNLGLRPMSSVLWQLPVPLPSSSAGGRLHRLPKLAPINSARLALIRAGKDWRDIPAALRLPEDGRRHAGKYGVQRDDLPAHAVIAEARTGKGWCDVADPRVSPRATRQNGGFGVNSCDGPAHAVLGESGIHNAMHSVTDPRVGGDAAGRQSGLYGVNASDGPAHAVLGSSRAGSSSWSCVSDPRLEHSPRDGGSHGVGDPESPSHTVIGRPGIANGWAAIADPRSECKRYDNSLGVSEVDKPYKSPVIGAMQIHNNPSSIADPRLEHAPRRDSYGVQDPKRPGKVVRGEHSIRQAPGGVADPRRLFRPTHEIIAGQPLTVSREAWVNGDFELVGPPVDLASKGRPTWLIIRAPDGTVHRPMTTLELYVLMGGSPWHRPGDPRHMEIGEDGGQWVDLTGNDGMVRKHIGNGVPIRTGTAIGNSMLEVLDAGASEVFSLSSGGIWVRPDVGDERWQVAEQGGEA